VDETENPLGAGPEQYKSIALEQSRIAEIGRIVSSTLNMDDVFAAFARQARELVPFDRLSIATIDPQSELITDAHVTGYQLKEFNLTGPRTIEESVLPKPVYENHQVFAANAELLARLAETDADDDNRVRIALGLRSAMFVPVVLRGSLVGTLVFRSRAADPYHDHEMALASQIASQIAGVIATGLQYAELERRSSERERLADEQTRIAKIGRIVSSTLDLDEVFTAFAEQAMELVPFDRLVISVINLDGLAVTDTFVHGDTASDGLANKKYPIADGIKEDVIASNTVLVANEVEFAEIVKDSPSELTRYEAGLKSLLMAPLTWQGAVVGTLAFRSRQSAPYGDHEVELARQISAQIAGAVASSNHYSLLERESSERQRLAENQARIAEIGRIVSSALNFDEVLSAFVEQARALVPFDRIVITVTNEDTTEVTDLLVDGIMVGDGVAGDSYLMDENALQRAVIVDQDILVENGSDYAARAENVPVEKMCIRAGLNSILLVPLIWQGRGIGSLNFRSVSHSAYGEREIELAKQIGAQIAGAIATATQYRQLEDAVSELRTQAAALEAAGDAMIILNPDTTIEYVNEAFVKETGYSREEVVGKKTPLLRSAKDSINAYDGMWDQVRQGKTWRATISSLKKDGTEYQVETSVTPVFGEDGAIVRFVGIRRDITERIQAERDRESRRELDAQNEQLLEIDRQRNEFFSTVSHELKTPLTAVIAFADILSKNNDGTLSNVNLEHLDVIKRNSHRLNSISPALTTRV